MMKRTRRIGALLLSVALLFTQLPAVAMAENAIPQDGSIASFEPLDSGVENQNVTPGTELDALNLPDTVTAEVYHVTEDTEITDGGVSTATPGNADKAVSENSTEPVADSGKTVTTVTTTTEEIPVAWDSDPAYDGETLGKYLFTANAGGYTLADGVKLPRITVTVEEKAANSEATASPQEPVPCAKTEGCTLADGHEGVCVTEQPPANGPLVKTVTGWTFVDGDNLNLGELALPGVSADNQADFDTVVSMLPTQISADIEGEADKVPVDITGWSCPEYIRDGDGNWPVSGEYIFTAALPEGYACDPLPEVRVRLEGAALLAGSNTYDGLTITGGTVTPVGDGQIKLTENGGDYTISGTWTGTLTADQFNLKNVIMVPDGVTVHITLDDVTIKATTEGVCVFAVTGTGTANITLSGTNTLESSKYRAGLEVHQNATVTIGGAGVLNATGGMGGAGIGGSYVNNTSGTITITGGTVTANGGSYSAGIGGDVSIKVEISGEHTKVTATGGSSAYDVGGNSYGGTLSVTDGAKLTLAKNGVNAAATYKNCTITDIKAGTTTYYDGSGSSPYSLEDMTAFQAILTAHPESSKLKVVDKDDPASWATAGLVMWDTTTSPYRLISLDLSNKGLMDTLDVGNLTALTFLDCSNNELSEITGLSGLSTLQSLYCQENQLDRLDVSGTALTELKCINNPYTSFTTKDGHTLTVTPANGGTVITTNYDKDSNELTLTATPDTGFTFEKWETLPAGATESGNKATFNLNSNMTVQASFAVSTDADNKGYHNDDVAAFKQILADHPELASIPGVDVDDPASWGIKLVQWDATTKRLTRLYLNNKGLTGTLDVSGLTGLNLIYCFENENLTGLTLGTQNYLTDLFCSSTGISGELDVSKCPALKRIWCEKTPDLTGLTLGQHNELLSFQCSASGISGELDVSNCPKLQSLGCKYNPALTGLTLGQQNELTDLKCHTNGISGELDVSGCPRLETLWCHENPGLTELKLGKKNDLVRLRCYFTSISGTLDVSDCPKLQTLWCSDNLALTGLVLGRLDYLTDLFCSTTRIKGTLDVSQCPKLQMLFCSDTPDMTELKLGTQSQLVSLLCTQTGLSGELDVSNCPQLKTLSCYDNKLETLNVSGLTALTWLDCFGNPLTAFTTKDGKMLTVGAGTGGKVFITNYDLSTNSAELTATPDSGHTFKTWSGLPAGAANTQTTSFALSDTIHVSAVFDSFNFSGGNGGQRRNHSRSTSRNYTITTPLPPKPNNPVLAVIDLPISVAEGKPAIGVADNERTAEALTEAGNKAGAKQNGIAVRYDAKTSLNYDGFSITIKRTTLDRLIAAKVKFVTLNTEIVDLTFDLSALQEIQKQATGDITLTAARETGLAGDALAAVGSRPAYRLTVNYTGADGKPATVDSFGAGRVTVGLAYTPAATEQAGSLYLVYSKDGQGAEWLYQSSYKVNFAEGEREGALGHDRTGGNVISSVGHFSVYGVGCKPAPAFTDTVNHWAKADIDFVASRGLLTGAGKTTFTPDGAITRGMFVTALGRLAGIDPAAYPSSSRFADVPGTAYYAPFVEWAAGKGIVSGTGEKTFSPDGAISREQIALMMQRYADKLGYFLPVAREAEIFADEGQITSGMKGAVQAMQQAGVMNGKGGHRFGPKDTATRAEAAAVLRRFVEVVIDPVTAGGWAQNDAGKWLYYEDSKPVTGWKLIDSKWYYFDAAGLIQAGGWKEIGGKWYYFYPDGAMAANTTIDGYEIGPDGVRKEN